MSAKKKNETIGGVAALIAVAILIWRAFVSDENLGWLSIAAFCFVIWIGSMQASESEDKKDKEESK